MWIRFGACGLALATMQMASAAAGPDHNLSSADRQFMAMAARTDMTEANEGQMAENQAASDRVRDLARALVQDHTKAYGELAQVAAQAGAKIPAGINTARIPTVQRLKHLKGANFDRQFARDEIADHQHCLAEFRREAAHGSDPAVKDYASKQISILEKHLQLAEQAAKSKTKS